MFTGKHLPLVFACAALCWMAAGCSGSPKSTNASGSSGTSGNSGLQFTEPASTPTVEAGQSVTLVVNQSVTWSIQPGSGFGICSATTQNCGSLTSQTSTSAMYTAPGAELNQVPACPDYATSSPQPPLQVLILATSTSDTTTSTSIPVIIDQNPPCIATIPSITLTTALGTQTYPSSQGNPPCPPAGSVIPYVSATNSSGVDPFQVGVFDQYPIYEGGGNTTPATPFGVGPYQWQLTSGSLPPGLSLGAGPNSASVVISGTPTSAGCSTFALQITDATGVSSTATLSLVVVPPTFSVQVPVLPTVFASSTAGVPYAPGALVASGGVPPYNWAYNLSPGSQVNGKPTLPPGICLTSATSTIPAGCTSGSTPPSSNVAMLWGTPQPGDAVQVNLNPPSPFTAPLQVNDSQQPYPAVALPYVSFTADIPPTFCSPANGPVLPTTFNGGVTTANSVPANSYLQGTYAFLLRGFDANGPVVIAGSVTADGAGNIVSGEEDISRSGGSQNVSIVPTGSSYNLGGLVNGSSTLTAVNRGCMTLMNSAGATTTFAFSLGGCSNHFTESGLAFTSDSACGMKQDSSQQNVPAGLYTTGRIIEFDDVTGQGTRASGILRAQDTTSFSAGLSGPFAFGLSGWDSAGGHYSLAGSTQAGSGTLSAAAADIDDAGALGSQLTGGSGTYTSLDANGRATGNLTVGPASYDLALYLVGGSEAIVMTTDALSANHPLIGGQALATAASFTNAAMQNTHIFHIGGVAPAGPDVSVGVLSFDGIGTISGTVYENQAGTLGTTAVSGVYLVDPNTGRTAFTTPQQGQTLGAHPFVGYVIPPASSVTRLSCSTRASCVTGFLVGTDSTAQDGVLEFQTSVTVPPPPFNNEYLEADYVYGADEILASTATNFEGDVYLRPSLSSSTAGSLGPTNSLTSNSPPFVFVQDASYGSITYCLQPNCQLLFPDEPLAGTYSVGTSGTGTLGGETVSVTNGNVIFYIDESPLDRSPSVVIAEQ